MVKGTPLTIAEQSAILALYRAKMAMQEISKEVKRSHSAVRTVVLHGRVRRRGARRGPPLKLKDATRRLLKRRARTGLYTARELRNHYAPHITVRRVHQVLHEAPGLRWASALVAPPLTQNHKDDRVKWCSEQLELGGGHWRRIIWSDEKRLSLDGPDGLRSYWADSRRERRWYSARVRGGASVMAWAAFSHYGISELVFVSGRMNAEHYCSILERALLPLLADHAPNTQYHQNNAPPHIANYIMQWLSDNDVDVLPWPARSPDLNSIENAWVELARAVYANGRQYDYTEDLEESMVAEWDKLSKQYIRNLVRSTPKR